MALISTHVLDTSAGTPAAGMALHLETFSDGAWDRVAEATTDDDGRVAEVAEGAPGIHRLVFDTDAYFGGDTFYPSAEIVFRVSDDEHHHVPLLVSPFGYTTYRGS